MTILTRRHFTLSALALAATAAAPARAQGATKSITTSQGTYDVPLNPQRVIAIDARLDLEPALALGLPVVGFSLRETAEPWVPVGKDVPFIGSPATRELVLSYAPDLIVCTDLPETELWPIDKLKDIAPVIPVDYELSWKDNLARMGEWLDRQQQAADFLADYEAALAAAKATHAEKLASRKVAAVWFEPSTNEIQILLGENTKNVTLAGQVLADLGGATIAEDFLGDYGVISMENAGEAFADVDAIIVDRDNTPSIIDALEANEMWRRLPAVAAGRVHISDGIYYGGCYSARRLVDEWAKTLALI